jgi:hypothetical protein
VTQQKAKKTWGERLKLTGLRKKDRDGPGNPARMAVNYGRESSASQQQRIMSPVHYGTVTSQSALARSMDYARYGTYGRSYAPPLPVIPTLVPVAAEAVYEEIAAVCLCGDNLGSGTHRSKSRLSKSCKRCDNKKSMRPKPRPSIGAMLNKSEDPYSFMRNARLLATEPSEEIYKEFPGRYATVHSIRSAAKPTRPKAQTLSQSMTRRKTSSSSEDSCWDSLSQEEMFNPVPKSRKSILECNVNPYEMMKAKNKSKRSSMVSKVVNYDSDDLSDHVHEHQQPASIRNWNSRAPTYQLLSDGETEDVSTSSKSNSSNDSSVYNGSNLSSNLDSFEELGPDDYAKISDEEVGFVPPAPPPPPPPPPLPPPLPDYLLCDESSAASVPAMPKRPPRHKRSITKADRPMSMGCTQDAVISQLKSILKKPPLHPTERSVSFCAQF